MTMQSWLLFCATEVVLCITPGPAVLCVVSMALRRGLRQGMLAAGGILASNSVYFALSATGVAAVIIASHALFTALKWAGAAYLIWLGARMLFTRAGPAPTTTPATPGSAHTAFLRGFLVQAANPKALIFFVALLPQFINASAGIISQVLILGVSSIIIEFSILSTYAAFAARAGSLTTTLATVRLERFGGGFLIAAGARLAWYRVD